MQKLTDAFGTMAPMVQGLLAGAGVKVESNRKVEKGADLEGVLALSHQIAFKDNAELFLATVEVKGQLVTVLAFVQPVAPLSASMPK